jgi:translocation and assembly module TamB
MRRRWIWRSLGVLLLLALIGAGVAWWMLRTQWFAEQVEKRAIAELEKATGGRAEIGTFKFDARTLTATLTNIILHGKEKPDQPPLLAVGETRVDLKLVSMIRRDIDVEAIVLNKPKVHVIIYPDGSTNIPEPKVKSAGDKNPIQTLLRLAAGRLEVNDGEVLFEDRKINLNFRAEQLRTALNYDLSGPRYTGELAAPSIHFQSGDIRIDKASVDSQFTLEANRLVVSKLLASWRGTRIEGSGAMSDWLNPTGEFALKATLPGSDAVASFGLPIEPTGLANFSGRVRFAAGTPFQYNVDGDLNLQGVGYRRQGVRIENVRAQGKLAASNKGIEISKLDVRAAGGSLTGSATLEDWKSLRIAANLHDLSMRAAANTASNVRVPWDGRLSGPVELTAILANGNLSGAEAKARLNISAAPDSAPVEGRLEAAWSQRTGKLQLGQSYFATPVTRIDTSGTLGEVLQMTARTTNLDDLQPIFALLNGDGPIDLPVQLKQGRAELTATVRGPLDNPVVEGRLAAGPLVAYKERVDRLQTDFLVSRDRFEAQKLTASRGSLEVSGQGSIVLTKWKPEDGAISARLAIRGAGLAELAKDYGSNLPISGIAQGSIVVTGTAKDPRIEADIAADKLGYESDVFSNVRVQATYVKPVLTIERATAGLAAARAQISGTYRHEPDHIDRGTASFEAAFQGVRLSQFNNRKWWPEDLEGAAGGTAKGTVRIENNQARIVVLNGEASLTGVQLGKEPVGALAVRASTENNQLRVSINGQVREAKLSGSGEWSLTGNREGSGNIQFTRVSLQSLQRLRFPGAPREEPQFEGFTDGTVTIKGSLNDFNTWQGVLELSSLRLNAKPEQMFRLGAEAQDLTFASVGPVRVTVDRNGARIDKAEFIGRNSRITANGTLAFSGKAQSDLAVKGTLNLAALQLFNPDLLARGLATVDATVKGTLDSPQINGRLRLQNASLYLTDLPSGVDNANGTVLFTRQRATIEELVAEIGGGAVRFGGFVEFGGKELVYRVSANADNVRIRYPEDVSITMDGALTLTGTSLNSLVSGGLTIVRASFQPKTDLGGLLAASSKPTAIPTTNEYLRGMQFDVRIESSQELRVTTSLTRELQVEAELRLRGTPVRPVLLGSISVTQGQIQVFGNDYRVNRGEIRFFNPVKIEPVFDADLETKARGVTVNISFSGPMNRLNVSYRSDPPLQSREIIALLAVGRDPQYTAGVPTGATTVNSQSSFLQTGGNTLLGQAVTQQISNRLQRFFGVSRIKIDPQLTGLDNLPQARLTLEQQISKEITLTYITNLNRAQEQIVRVQYDVDRNWSVLATRDGNGVFGIDVLFRKSFR